MAGDRSSLTGQKVVAQVKIHESQTLRKIRNSPWKKMKRTKKNQVLRWLGIIVNVPSRLQANAWTFVALWQKWATACSASQVMFLHWPRSTFSTPSLSFANWTATAFVTYEKSVSLQYFPRLRQCTNLDMANERTRAEPILWYSCTAAKHHTGCNFDNLIRPVGPFSSP